MAEIPQPYDQMLNALSECKGYSEFRNFVNGRLSSSKDWRAEIKALFELNKPSHHLIKICSHEESEPEGIFDLHGQTAILEVAHIGYLFHRNERLLAIANRLAYSFNPLTRLMTDRFSDYAVLITIPSIKLNPAQNILTKARKLISAKFREGNDFTLKLLYGEIGIIDVGPYEKLRSLAENLIPREALQIMITANGRIERASNTDLTSKVEQVLRTKRKQHLKKYMKNVKIFYFFIDCPIDKSKSIDKRVLLRRLSCGEVLVICAIEGVARKSSNDVCLIEHKILLGDTQIIEALDLANPYFEQRVASKGH